MKPQNELALVIAYYLSRVELGHEGLGYRTFTEASKDIGSILGVKPNTIKNMRDEFDFHVQDKRKGWDRELRPSRLKVLETFQDSDDDTLHEIVLEILGNKDFVDTEEGVALRRLFDDRDIDEAKRGAAVFISRGPTGRAAEKYFMDYHARTSKPVAGDLIDGRDLGGGYDFEIISPSGSTYVEVKGLAENDGGVSLTNKQWQMAKKFGDRYYLAFVRNILAGTKCELIKNPYKKVKAVRHVQISPHVSWGVSMVELENASKQPRR